MNSNPRILLVDDEPRVGQSLKILLEDQGFEVEPMESGLEALDAMSHKQFDLFLFDICMPEMDGFLLVEETIKQEPDVPVIMMTGKASIESAIRALQNGAYDYLRKPFEPEDLIKTVKNALEQKNLKDKNREITQQLIMSERRYRYLVHNSPDMIYTLDNEGRFTFVNEAFERLLGFRAEDLIGKPYCTVVHKSDHQKARGLFSNSRSAHSTATDIQLRFAFCNDSEKFKECEIRHLTIELKATGEYDESADGDQKRFLATHGVARDVSYRKHLEYQLREAQKMEAMGSLARGIAHDFNNVLMGIQGYASLMQYECEDPSHPNRGRLKNIEDHILTGMELTRQILGFAKTGESSVRPVNVNGLLKKTATMFGGTKKDIGINSKFQPDVWFAEIDEGQIKQVLLNLYVNAWQAMPDGGEISLETENVSLFGDDAISANVLPGNYVKISVADTGIGMDEHTQQRIFEPFFTTKRRGSGTGLGLASAYGIIKNHNGTVKVLSKKGRGTTFVIYLPAVKKRPSEKMCNLGR